jgi:DNA-directed RNA polymerase subunit RPC12/RpoP
MTYIFAQSYKCPTCKTITEWSPHIEQTTPTTSKGKPICPVCWDKFLSTLNAEIECTVDFGNGNNYENRYGKAQEKC